VRFKSIPSLPPDPPPPPSSPYLAGSSKALGTAAFMSLLSAYFYQPRRLVRSIYFTQLPDLNFPITLQRSSSRAVGSTFSIKIGRF